MNLKQLQEKRRAISTMVNEYRANPQLFNDEDISNLQQLSQMFGVRFEPMTTRDRLSNILAGNIAETATFGLMPDAFTPRARTSGERTTAGLGTLIGLAGAAPIGALAVRGGTKRLQAGIPKAIKGGKATYKKLVELLTKG